MRNDEIDEMLTKAVPIPHPGRWRGLDVESSRSLTETSTNRSQIGHLDGRRGDSFLQENDRMKPNDPRRARDTFSDEIATEILSKTHGTRESGDDFLTAATRAVEHAVRTVAAESRDPAESAGAIIAGVLRGAGDNDDMALKTLSLAAGAVLREALLLGYGPTPWIQGVLLGAVRGARNLGLQRENAVSAAAQGILEGAGEARFARVDVIGTALERAIRAAMASLIPLEHRRDDDDSNEAR